MGKTWAIASGSGGVGKTTIALSLAAESARKGLRTILLDASGISRACDLILGLESIISTDLVDVLTQQIEIKSALYPVPSFDCLSLAVASLAKTISVTELSGMILVLQSMSDVLVIDLPAGVLPPDQGIMNSDDAILVVVYPDDASIRSAERLIQQTRGSLAQTSLIVNRLRKDRVKKGLQYHADAVAMTLDCPVVGVIQEDDHFASGIAKTKALSSFLAWGYNPIKSIAANLLQTQTP